MKPKSIDPVFDFFEQGPLSIGDEVVFASVMGLRHGKVHNILDAEGRTVLDVRSLIHPRRWEYVAPDQCVKVVVEADDSKVSRE